MGDRRDSMMSFGKHSQTPVGHDRPRLVSSQVEQYLHLRRGGEGNL